MAAQPSSSKTPASGGRYLPCVFFVLFSALLFIGGTAAALYLVFVEYSGVRNIWLLACGAPVAVVLLGLFVIYTLYGRFGRPLRQIFSAIDAVAEGNLAVRVPADNSPQFGELIKRFNKMVAELERAEQQRRNLTADIAHELRTPLHLIQGNLEGLLDGVYQPTPEHLTATLEETRLLTRLVNDLQTLSLAETGQLPLHPARFLAADLLQDLAASFAARAATLGIELDTRLADPEQPITADYDRLDQVLSNLMANALRHTPPGGRITLEAGAGEGRGVRIQVIDTGSGIPAEDLPFVFDRFWRGDRSRSERTHSGLGLAIARQLILAHGGKITVESVVGAGTRFIIDLPAPA
ncbi:MAG: HAMP domain-containing histidine kinase [Anaerolineales bacterium]|nr:HAMP domain-containing histidine kinase [Anaerolineales bacterium]